MPTYSPSSCCPQLSAHPTQRRRLAGMIAVVTALAAVSAGVARSDDSADPPARIRMAIPDQDEIGVKKCIDTAVNAANDEDLDAFLGCFATPTRAAIRRQMALVFVRHEISVELVDKHVISRDKNRAELAMSYTTTLSEEIHQVVSLVELRQENDRWLIKGESIVSKSVKRPRQSSSSACGPGGCPPGPCFGGQCGVPGIQPVFPPGNKPGFQIFP